MLLLLLSCVGVGKCNERSTRVSARQRLGDCCVGVGDKSTDIDN